MDVLTVIQTFIWFLLMRNIQSTEPHNLNIKTFDEYKKYLNRSYYRNYEEQRSRNEFVNNLNDIEMHNQKYKDGQVTFQIRANQFADMSNDNYLKTFVRLSRSNRRKVLPKVQRELLTTYLGEHADTLPENFDWRDEGFVTPECNQKSCGSCYAFSIAHTVQAQIYKRIGRVIPLSEQQIVDCSIKMGNHGCGGGSLRNTLKYIQQSGGLMRAKEYPYTAAQHKCHSHAELSVVNITTWGILPFKNEDAMKMAIATIGPIAISINASPKTFQLYSHGIYDDPNCNSLKVNHAMLAIGYTPDYWILKNWWGANWGDHGYMHIKRGKNMCGLANFVAYSIV